MNSFKRTSLSLCVSTAILGSASFSAVSVAEEADKTKLEVIEVTARKRVENVQEVPVSVSALQGENLDVYSSAGMDIRFMSARIPSLAVESSFGRSFPRFYIRGLGNTDFDLNASQPVSYVVDDVVQENPILKGFPVFDVERVEVLRGPQGTLFGRNTPAGLVKFDSVKPSQIFDGYVAISYGSRGAIDSSAAFGGGLTDNLSVRVSGLHQSKDDYIDNRAVGFEQADQLGGYEENAARIQFLYEGNDFTALFNYHFRDLDGSPIIFHPNIATPGTNKIRSGFKSDVVYQDAGQFATQQVETQGSSLKLEWDFSQHTLTSITAWESAEIYSRADVDGGYNGFPPAGDPNAVWWGAQTADEIPDHEQFTQELRLASNFTGNLNYQVGLFYFSEELTINTYDFYTRDANSTPSDPAHGAQNGESTQFQDTTAWAIFGSVDYDVTDDFSVTVGLRYSDDEKEFTAELIDHPFIPGPDGGNFTQSVNPSDSHVSWDISSNYKITPDMNWYARIANSFRAPSVQGRVLYDQNVSVADSETITSYETGIKSDILDGSGRLNASVYYFNMDNQQLTAVGGNANSNTLLNADTTTGYGIELDSEFIVSENIIATFNISYNKTEIDQPGLAVAACGSGTCTVTDPTFQVPGGFGPITMAYIDGNSLPNSPEWISNLTLSYAKEIGDGEFFIHSDLTYRSEVDFFLYRAKEFEGESLVELGARTGYNWIIGDNEYEVSAFVRNLTDEQVIIGGVDFNNNSGMVNEERFYGAEFKVSFF
ncbi:TonB-dependent receptor [Litorilituus lipolyticus]|uniref:TonB-dependent receptor n=1 Tax=Litorilituus lipolyticus TaxID=2491017 RepID=A0A502L7X6_9GAMM|nr:TonB-dependent receptor [Litorilituus lipolyticus]TPH16477.1 TonB-dependent receptor [Litorilituus lipolyticus]